MHIRRRGAEQSAEDSRCATQGREGRRPRVRVLVVSSGHDERLIPLVGGWFVRIPGSVAKLERTCRAYVLFTSTSATGPNNPPSQRRIPSRVVRGTGHALCPALGRWARRGWVTDGARVGEMRCAPSRFPRSDAIRMDPDLPKWYARSRAGTMGRQRAPRTGVEEGREWREWRKGDIAGRLSLVSRLSGLFSRGR